MSVSSPSITSHSPTVKPKLENENILSPNENVNEYGNVNPITPPSRIRVFFFSFDFDMLPLLAYQKSKTDSKGNKNKQTSNTKKKKKKSDIIKGD